jgi:hypothetical protein
MGFCHDDKSEQVTCSEQEQDAKHPSKIMVHQILNPQQITCGNAKHLSTMYQLTRGNAKWRSMM